MVKLSLSVFGVQTGLRFNPKAGLGLLVQMLWFLWTVWFWHDCLGNECNDITVPAKCVIKRCLRYTVVCIIRDGSSTAQQGPEQPETTKIVHHFGPRNF